MHALFLASLLLAQQDWPDHRGNMIGAFQFVPGALGPLSTHGAVAVSVNPTTGNDTSCAPCKTVGGALATLPPFIQDPVTITIANGTFSAAMATFFGDFSRFSYANLGAITIKSASEYIKAVGTATSYTLSAATKSTLTFTADPGFALNAYRGYYVKILSGTGAGGRAVVRTNNGTAWTIAGEFNAGDPNATSVIQIQDDASEIDFTDAFGIYPVVSSVVKNTYTVDTGPKPAIVFDGITWKNTNQAILSFNGFNLHILSSRFLGLALLTVNCSVGLGFVDIDGLANTTLWGIDSTGSTLITDGSQASSMLVVNTGGDGIEIDNPSTILSVDKGGTFLFDIALDGNTGDGIACTGAGVSCSFSSRVHGTGNGGHGVNVSGGAQALIPATIIVTGTAGDVLIDGATYTWANVAGGLTDGLSYVGPTTPTAAAETLAGAIKANGGTIVGTLSVRASGGTAGSEQFGGTASTTAANGLSVGTGAVASAQQAIAVGYNSTGAGIQAVAVGASAAANNQTSVAIGQAAGTSATDAVAIGRAATGSATGAVAVGDGSIASGTVGIAVGQIAQATDSNAIAIGQDARATNGPTLALGSSSRASNVASIAIGDGASSSQSQSIAIGQSSTASGIYSVAIGGNTTAGAQGSIALGRNSTTSTYVNALAIGEDAAATGNNKGEIGTSGKPIAVKVYGGVQLGSSGVLLKSVLTNSGTLDFGNLATLGCEDLTIAVTGAVDGDPVILGTPNASIVANSSYSAWVSAADTVTVRYCTFISGNPTAGTFTVDVVKQ